SKSKQKQFDHKVAYPRLIKSLWHVSAGTRRGRARSIVGPARKYLQTRSALKKEGSEPPLPRSLSAAGFVSHSRRQLFANAAIAPKGATSSSAEENFGFWIDEPTKIVTFADGKKLNVRRFDDHWISAVSGDVSYELDRQNGRTK